jgi:hypothetical protein
MEDLVAAAAGGAAAPWAGILDVFKPQGQNATQTVQPRSDAGFFAVMGIALIGVIVLTALMLKK